MPHNAGHYVETTIFPKGNAYQINYIEASQLLDILLADALDYYYSAVVSTAGAYISLDNGQYSWSTTQLYYSTFYILRGLLAIDGICVCYQGTKPRTLEAKPNKSVVSVKAKNSTTHGLMIDLANNHLNSKLFLSQQIEGESPLEWMMNKRINANYRNSRYPEPERPKHFDILEKYTLRKLTGIYIDDTSYTYTFDSDHAIIAYNIFLLRTLKCELQKLNKFELSDDDQSYIKGLFSDSHGPISVMHKMLLE